jgi:hypothetical protein
MSDWHIFSLTVLLASIAFIFYAIWQDFPPRGKK